MIDRVMAAIGIAFVVLSAAAMVVLHIIGHQISAIQRTMAEYAILGWPQRITFGVSVLSISSAATILLVLKSHHVVAGCRPRHRRSRNGDNGIRHHRRSGPGCGGA